MHPSEVNRIRKEIWRLALAEQDMRLVAEAALELRESGVPLPVLEAGLVTIYCRSFSGIPKLPDWESKHIVDRLGPKFGRHLELWEARNRLYAHTDEDYEHRRKTVDVFGSHRHRVEPTYLNKAALGEIQALALAHAETFKDAREEREQMLRDANVPPDLPSAQNG